PGSRGAIGQYVEKFGPGLHSLAWRVDDLWVTENLIRSRGIHITGTNLPARHFFMHPKDTFGVLIEWTDGKSTHVDAGAGAGAGTTSTSGPAIDVAWITAVVRNVKEVRSFL